MSFLILSKSASACLSSVFLGNIVYLTCLLHDSLLDFKDSCLISEELGLKLSSARLLSPMRFSAGCTGLPDSIKAKTEGCLLGVVIKGSGKY